MSNINKGVMLITCSALFFALMSVFVRLSGDVPSVQKMVFRNSISAIIAGGMLIKSRTPLRVPKESICPLFTRTFFGLISVVCNYYAIDHLLLANSNSLSKLSPFFAIAFAAIYLKEKVTVRQVCAISLALIGSAFLILPNMSVVGMSAIIGLLGGICSGAARVSLRALRRNDNISNSVIVFVFSIVSFIAVLIPSLLHWEPITWKQFCILILAGAACAVAQYCLTGAYRYAASKDIEIFDFSQILFSAAFGFIIFGQIPTRSSWIAYGFILVAAGLLYKNNQKEKES